jgi:hypothetical protein
MQRPLLFADLVEYLSLTRVVVRKDWTNSDFVLRSEVWEAAADLAQTAFGTSMSSRLPDTGYNDENRHEYSSVTDLIDAAASTLDEQLVVVVAMAPAFVLGTVFGTGTVRMIWYVWHVAPHVPSLLELCMTFT